MGILYEKSFNFKLKLFSYKIRASITEVCRSGHDSHTRGSRGHNLIRASCLDHLGGRDRDLRVGIHGVEFGGRGLEGRVSCFFV